ncbi:Gustatory receptor 33 [Cephus cinctus]|nr:Gustatory receptor 33 [Cephus cinctus]
MSVVDLPDVLGVLGHSRFSIFVYRIFGLGVIRYRGRYLRKTTILLRFLTLLSVFGGYWYILEINTPNEYKTFSKSQYEIFIIVNMFITVTIKLWEILFMDYYTKQFASYIEDIGAIDRKFAKFKIYNKRSLIYLIEIIAMIMFGCKYIVQMGFLLFWEKYSFINFCFFGVRLYARISIFLYNIVLIDLIYWIYQRLKLINEICSSVDALAYSMDEQNDTIRMLAEQHYAILKIAKRTTKLFQFSFVTKFISNYTFMISTLIIIYKCLIDEDICESLLFFLFQYRGAFFNAIGIIGICYVCDLAVTQAHQTKMILHRTTLNKSYMYLIPELRMFMTYLTDEILSFEPYQLFNIDKSLMIVILGNGLAFFTIAV